MANTVRTALLSVIFLVWGMALVRVITGWRRVAPWVGLTPAQVTAVVRHRNVGLAYLEQPDARPDLAEREFRAMTAIAPHIAMGHANLAAAMLARPKQHAQALAEARTAVELAPGNAAMRRLLAELLAPSNESMRQIQRQNARSHDDFISGAIEQLQAALRVDPNNSRALFQLARLYEFRAGGDLLTPARGDVLQQLALGHRENLAAQLLWLHFAAGSGRTHEARAALDRVVALAQPWTSFGSRFLSAARASLRAGDPARAADAVQVLSNLLRATRRYQTDWTALESGPGDPSAFAVREFRPPPPPPAPSSHVPVRFVDVTAAMGLVTDAAGRPPAAPGTSAATALAVAPAAEKSPLTIYLASPAGGRLFLLQRGRLLDVTRAAGLAGARATVAAFIDVDNDRTPDLYLAGPLLPPRRGRPLGGSNDPDRIFRGLEGGRFQRVPIRGLPDAAPSGTGRPRSRPGPVLDVRWEDGDQDGALDLLRLEQRTGSGCVARLFRNTSDFTFIEITRAAGLYRNLGTEVFRVERVLPPLPAGFTSRDVAAFDFDNDGRRDFVLAGRSRGGGSGGLRLLRGEEGGVFTDATAALPAVPAARAVAPADLDGDGATDLIVLREDGGLTLLRNAGGARNHWLEVTLEGEVRGSQKNNSFGLGATLEVMRGREYQKLTVREPVTHFGLGAEKTAIDVVRIVWPNGKRQSLVRPWAPRLDTRVQAREFVYW
jgi:hypothetical protein